MSANGKPATPDLVGALREIEREAKTAQRRLAAGEARNGVSSLKKIEYEASDALARAEASK